MQMLETRPRHFTILEILFHVIIQARHRDERLKFRVALSLLSEIMKKLEFWSSDGDSVVLDRMLQLL